MKRKLLTAFALAAVAAAGTASAATSAYIAVNPQPVYVEPARPVYGPPVYGPPAYAYESHEYEHGGRWHEREGCHAHRWDPNVRYMPGQAVWRNGQVYVARGISSQVYNQNSPPEWTPNYWAPARCD